MQHLKSRVMRHFLMQSAHANVAALALVTESCYFAMLQRLTGDGVEDVRRKPRSIVEHVVVLWRCQDMLTMEGRHRRSTGVGLSHTAPPSFHHPNDVNLNASGVSPG